jgi:Mg2+/citrate symporter
MFLTADEIVPAYSSGVLLLIAAAAVAVLLVLIMRFKLHAFVALVLVSFLTALATKVPFAEVVPTLLSGFGSTLASVALLVGFGAMIGRMLEVTGGAQVLADTLINRFGPKRAPLALGVASLLFGFPIFFDAGLVVMLPIIFSVARRFGGSVLTYALPAAGAFAVMHASSRRTPVRSLRVSCWAPTSASSSSSVCSSACRPGTSRPTSSVSGPVAASTSRCPSCSPVAASRRARPATRRPSASSSRCSCCRWP